MEHQLPPHLVPPPHDEENESDDGTADAPSDESPLDEKAAGQKRKARLYGRPNRPNKSANSRAKKSAIAKDKRKEGRVDDAATAKVTAADGAHVGVLVAAWIKDSTEAEVATILSLLNQGDIVDSVLFGLLRSMNIKKNFNIDQARSSYDQNPNYFFGQLLASLDAEAAAEDFGKHAYFVELFLEKRRIQKERASKWRKASDDKATLAADPAGPCAFLLDSSRDKSVPLPDSQRDLVYALVEKATRPLAAGKKLTAEDWINSSKVQKQWDTAAAVLHVALIDYTGWKGWNQNASEIYKELAQQAAARKSWPRGAAHAYDAEAAVGLGWRNDQRGKVGIYRARKHKAVDLGAKQMEAFLTLTEAGLGDFLHLLVEGPLAGIVGHGRDLTAQAGILGGGWSRIATTLSIMVKFDALLHAESATDPTFSYSVVVNAKKNKFTTPGSCDFALPALDGGRGLLFAQKPGIGMAWAAKRLLHGSSWPWIPHSSPWHHWTEEDDEESGDEAPPSEDDSEDDFAGDAAPQAYVPPPPTFRGRKGLRSGKGKVVVGSEEPEFANGEGHAMRLGGGAGPAGPRTRSMANKQGHRAGICAWQKLGMVKRAKEHLQHEVDQVAKRVIPEGRRRGVGRAFELGGGVLPARI